MDTEIIKQPKGKFLKVKCLKCKNEQVIFEKSTSNVKCLVCNEDLSGPRGGKAKVKAKVLEALE